MSLTLCMTQVAATTMHHKALQQQLAGNTHSTTSAQPAVAMPSSSNHGPTASVLHSKVAEIAVKREDEELHQKRAVERRGLPSNVDGFKWVLASDVVNIASPFFTRGSDVFIVYLCVLPPVPSPCTHAQLVSVPRPLSISFKLPFVCQNAEI